MNDSYLCIDIGTSSIKAVEKDSSDRVLRWGILERRSKPFHTNIQPLDIADAAKHLKMLIEKMGSQTKSAVVSVPAFLLLLSMSDTPDPRSVPAVAETFRAFAIQLDTGRYLLIGLPNEITEKYVKIFTWAGLELIHMESESAALAKVFGKGNEATLIADVGDRFTTYTVAKASQPIFIRPSDFGISSMAPDVIIKEAEKIAAEWSPNKIILTGGGANLIKMRADADPSPLFSICNGLQRPPL